MAIHASRYTVTDAGARFAPRFCYGHREVTSIDSFTPPAVANGFNQTTIAYYHEMKEVPAWARAPEVQAAFPEMASGGPLMASHCQSQPSRPKPPANWQVPSSNT